MPEKYYRKRKRLTVGGEDWGNPRVRFKDIYGKASPFGKYILDLITERSYSVPRVREHLHMAHSTFYQSFLLGPLYIPRPDKLLITLAQYFRVSLTRLMMLYFFGDEVGKDEQLFAHTLAFLSLYLGLPEKERGIAETVINALVTQVEEKKREAHKGQETESE